MASRTTHSVMVIPPLAIKQTGAQSRRGGRTVREDLERIWPYLDNIGDYPKAAEASIQRVGDMLKRASKVRFSVSLNCIQVNFVSVAKSYPYQ